MVRTAGVERPPTPPPPPASVINSNSDVGDEEAGESSGVVGGVGVGEGAHLTKLVLKFTTASESDVQPSCEVGLSIHGWLWDLIPHTFFRGV